MPEEDISWGDAQAPSDPEQASLRRLLEKTERGAIRKALRTSAGDVSGAARFLGVGRSTLYRRMKRLGLTASRG